MADIHFDDFIANVHPDPAKPEATIMLFGYIGQGADGEVRVYPDPTLGTWYDIPAADVVHSVPGPDAKLGGSYVWVRASAQIKPGSIAAAAAAAAAAAPEASAADAAAGVAAPAAAQNFTIGAGCTFICAQPGGGVHPTPTALPTPATHCFICPPHISPAFICNQPSPPVICVQPISPPVVCNLPSPPIFCNQPFSPPVVCNLPVSPVVICNQPSPPIICQHTPPVVCLQTQPNICTIVASPNCPGPGPGTPVQTPQVGPQQQFAAAAMQPMPTAQTHCFVCPPHTQPPQCPHPVTQVSLCTDCTLPPLCQTHTLPTVCTQPPACPHQTAATLCTQNLCHSFVDCTIVGCTHFVCPTQPNVCTHQPGCVQQPTRHFICSETCVTLPNVCTHQPGCVQPTRPFICSETCVTLPINCIPQSLPHVCQGVSPNCPGPGPGTPVQTPQVGPQQQFAAAAVQPTPTVQTHCFVCPPLTHNCTAATVCTQPPACPHTPNCTPATVCTHPLACPHTVPPVCHPSVNVICPTPSAVHQCGGNTAATVCTQPPACQPSVNVICPTPSAVHQCGAAAAAAAPQPMAGTALPTLGCVTPANGCMALQPTPTVQTHCFVCPPLTQHCTAATVCTQPPACLWSAPPHCPPHTVPPACPQHTVATVCTQPPAQCGVFTPFCPQ
jgi:hypothetical protein